MPWKNLSDYKCGLQVTFSGPIKVNKKMAFFGFEMDFFRVFNISLSSNTIFEKLGLQYQVFSGVSKLGFRNLGLKLILKTRNWRS